MFHTSPALWDEEKKYRLEMEKCFWYNGRAIASNHIVFSIVVVGLSSLINSMSTAFSPFTASTLKIYDDSFWESMLYFSPNGFSSGHGPTSSFGYVSATSDDTSEESIEECIQDETTIPNKKCIEQDPISSSIAAIKNRTKSMILRIPVTITAFKRRLQKPPKKSGENHTFPISEVFVPNERSRLDAINNQRLRKRKIPSNISSEREESDDNNETIERKKVRRMLGRQIRKNERKGRQWEAMFQLLVEYKREYGNTLVPINHVKKNKQLGKWVAIQRHSYKTNNLSEIRREILGSIGFSWNIQKPSSEWMKFYKYLIINNEEHRRSTTVPFRFSDNKRLESWVHRQRIKFRKNLLAPIEVDLLNSIGFLWDIRMESNEKSTGYQVGREKFHKGSDFQTA